MPSTTYDESEMEVVREQAKAEAREEFAREQETRQKTKAQELARLRDEEAQAQAQQLYGPTAAAGGGTPSRPAVDDNQALKERIWGKLQRGEGLQRSQDKLDFPRFAGIRLREAILASDRDPTYRRMSPAASDDRAVRDDRVKRPRSR